MCCKLNFKPKNKGCRYLWRIERTHCQREYSCKKSCCNYNRWCSIYAGKKNVGLIGERDVNFSNFKGYHSIIQQQNLCGKVLKYSHVMNVVVKVVNSIRGRPLQHRLFKTFLEELETLPCGDLIFYSEIRWLSRGIVLQRFLELIPELKTFLVSRNEIYNEFDDII